MVSLPIAHDNTFDSLHGICLDSSEREGKENKNGNQEEEGKKWKSRKKGGKRERETLFYRASVTLWKKTLHQQNQVDPLIAKLRTRRA